MEEVINMEEENVEAIAEENVEATVPKKKLTRAEIQKAYRERKKISQGADIAAQKNKEKCKKFREDLDIDAKKKYTVAGSERKKEHRLKKKTESLADNEPVANSPSGYKTKQALGKAVKRVSGALSHSPSKKIAVVSKIAREVGLKVVSPMASPRVTGPTALSQDTRLLVQQFYVRDDISRQLPGKKDVKRVMMDGKKTTVAKRLLMFNLREAYKIFKQEHPEVQIGLSKFCTLRLSHVQLVSSKSQECCCCPYCENIKFLLSALTWNIQPDGSQIREATDLARFLVCDVENPNCMKRICQNCPIATDISQLISNLINEERDEITIKQWKGALLIQESHSLADIFEMIQNQMNRYIKHIYTYRIQSKALRNQKLNLKAGHIILQTDFAENYALKHQGEVMAAHRQSATGESATIYTAVAYYLNKSLELKEVSFAVISNTTTHSSTEVCVFNKMIIDYLRTMPEPVLINFIHFWTDGAASQFKNRFTIAVMTFHDELYGCKSDWNFCESYHGKGPHDGIGAVIKWNVYRRVLQGRATVVTAEDLYRVGNELTKATVCLYASKQEIAVKQPIYQNIWKDAKTAKGIQQCRHIKTLDKFKIELYRNSLDNDLISTVMFKSIPTSVLEDESSTDSDESDIDSDESGIEPLEEIMSDISLHSEISEISVSSSTVTDMTSQSESPVVRAVSPGTFVLVKYERSKGNLFYVAQVTKLTNCDKLLLNIDISCMRKNDAIGFTSKFTFPQVKDDDSISTESIVKILPDPSIIRQIHSWKNVEFREHMASLKALC